ncbi:restriction endonuclease subunit S [Delftia acidovorans]|uniref:restriction endonuclease subunit S n=1 Tax=Delftia acidovorans TaxID=80866 RepID=UPI0032E01E5F
MTTGEIQFNTITDSNEKITEAGLQNSAAKLFPPGTLLMAMYGQGKTRGQVAKLGIEAATNQNSAAILLNDGYDPDFYFHVLSSEYDNIREFGHTGGISHLNAGILKQFSVPVAPILEQRRIASIISTWDHAIVAAKQLLNNGEKRRKGLAQTLLLGKKRFRHFTAPWVPVTFGEVMKEVKRRVEWDDEELYPLISVRRRSEGAFHRDTLKGSEILTKKLNYARKGEFLISKMQVFHGAMAIVPEDLDGMFISDSYISFKSANESIYNIGFVGWLSTTQQMYRSVRRCSYGVHVEKMTFDIEMFLNERFFIPTDIEEQKLICSVLSNADAEVKAAKSHLEQLKEEKSALMSQLLTGKRRVKLTEEDNPAQT